MARTTTTTHDHVRNVALVETVDAASSAEFSVDVGFTPRYVRVEQPDDRNMHEWFEGMTAAHAIRTVAAGTRTLETSKGITVTSDDTNGHIITVGEGESGSSPNVKKKMHILALG